MSELGVAEIWQFPVKSMGGTQVQETLVDPMGIEGDREFAVYDYDSGQILSRKDPRNKALLEITALFSDGILQLAHPGLGELACEAGSDASAPVSFEVLGDAVQGVPVSPELGAFVSEVFKHKKDVALVRMPENHRRLVDPNFLAREFHTRYTDGYPLTIVSRESLAALRGAMGSFPELPANMNDLIRANFVIEGDGPFVEDYLGQLVMGTVLAEVIKASTRCVMTEQYRKEDGTVASDRLKTLSTLRKMGRLGFNGTNVTPQVMIAQNAVVLGPGRMSVNDIVHVLSDSEEPNWRKTRPE